MTSTSNWDSTTSGIIVAYFSSGEDAQNAINELVDEGFAVDEIGAVFHSPGTAAAAGTTGSPSRPHHDELTQMGSTGSAAGASGAESDTSGVTPAGLATGSGTGFIGAPRPGPIPGSEIPGDIPSELPSSLASAGNPRASEVTARRDLDNSYAGLSASPASAAGYGRESTSRRRYEADGSRSDESWWDKLRHTFAGRKHEPQSDKSTSNFGTGEGQLGVAEHEYPYYGSAFESSFVGMGVPEARARHLSGVIRRGGAIITVSAEARQAEAENILARNDGLIKEEAGTVVQSVAGDTGSEAPRLLVFGRVQRVYPGYLSSDKTVRRAS